MVLGLFLLERTSPHKSLQRKIGPSNNQACVTQTPRCEWQVFSKGFVR